jgi:hypothetical protein
LVLQGGSYEAWRDQLVAFWEQLLEDDNEEKLMMNIV